MTAFDDLFEAAEEELRQQETPEEWGELRQPAEHERLLTRYLGEALLPPFGSVIYRFVDYPGERTPFYLKHKAQLGKGLEDANAQVGDVVALVRGGDKDIGKDYPMETWAVRAKPWTDPQTGGASPTDGIPFAPSVC
jgi:hypothetical protein